MVVSILLLLLLIIVTSSVFFFLFIMFLPSLKAQKINAADPLFSKEEVDAVMKYNDFKFAKNGIQTALHTPDGLSELLGETESPKESSLDNPKKDFQFWSKCYKMAKALQK